MKKKIAIVCGALGSGGAERVLSVLSSPLADEFDITLFTWRKKPIFYEYDRRIRIIDLPSISGHDNHLSKGWALRRWVKQNKPNLVISFLRQFNLLVLTSLLSLNIPKIVAERNDPRFTPGGWPVSKYTSIIYRTASGILCQTESIRKFFKGRLESRCHIIYNPVKLPKSMIGKALETPKRDRIVIVGRLHPQKNHKLAIDAFSIFQKNHPSYTLSIYGEGPLKNEIQSYIDSLNLSNSIILEGAVCDVMKKILDAKVFLMTSDFEGMPNALIEAMCLGLPCVSTPVSGAVDLIINGKNGAIVKGNADTIAEVLSHLVEEKSNSVNFAVNATKLYDSLKTEKISKEWIDYFNSIIGYKPS